MGVDKDSARFFLQAYKNGADFNRTLTLGRQRFCLSNNETRTLLKTYDIDPNTHPSLFETTDGGFADEFWKLLGASEITSLDASEFEGATLIHDLNKPISSSWHQKYDAVCDIGTLEHVFNFSTAIRNCLNLIRPGGSYFAVTPTNNQCGHGFYQFSPELYYRLLSPSNGFRVLNMVAVEYGPTRRWFSVSDPLELKKRINLINSWKVMLFIHAERIDSNEITLESVQQSDYSKAWKASPKQPKSTQLQTSFNDRLRSFLLDYCPSLFRILGALIYSRFNRNFSFRNKKAFKRLQS